MSLKQKPVTYKTAGATLTYAEMGDIVVNSASANDQTLPTPSPNLWYRVSNVGAGVVTIKYGGATITTLNQYEQALLLANGISDWWMSKGGGDITKAEIESVLTGEISSHSHADPSGLAPTGGSTGQVLAKNSATNYDYSWADGPAATNGIPAGGTADQLLAKIDGTDYNCEWVDASAAANGIPSGGTAGQVLTKDSATDYDVSWKTREPIARVSLGSSDFDVGSSTWTEIQWVTEVTDEAGAVDLTSYNKRITVPSGYTKINLKAYIPFVNNSSNYRFAQIRKNGTGNPIVMRSQAGAYETGLSLDTGWITCSEGDYFEVLADSTGGQDVLGSGTWGGPAWFEAEFRE